MKTEPTFDARARTAEIVIDDDDALASPAETEGAIDQSILQPRRFLVTFDLLNCRLTDVDDGQSLTMPGERFSLTGRPAAAA